VETLFAPAARRDIDGIRKSFADLTARLRYDFVLDLVPSTSFIVNETRQVIFANASALSALGLDSSEVIGARPGEIVKCVHARETLGGCGTTEACRVCGVVSAVLEALEDDKKSVKECRIVTEAGGATGGLDLLVTAVPISAGEGRFAVVTLHDIGDSKRRQVLERLFFHDLMNGLSNLQACVILLNKEFGSMVSEHDYFARLSSATKGLIDEVCQQRELMTMESGDLEAELREIDLGLAAREAAQGVELADYAEGKRIALLAEGEPVIVFTDPVLLKRIVVNMLKNALEASGPGEEVSLRLAVAGERAELSVRNSAYIPRELQLQIFQRSFSTKGRGRGIGTYSMRMLAERYLGAEIGFTSDEREGTTFRLLLPRG
jgi:nitrogen fixation/metabolism regulation signal transduction histidine kinase